MIPLRGIPELDEGDDLGALLAEATARVSGLESDDVVVVAQKAVSKVEGRVVHLEGVEASEQALQLAGDGDARRMEMILRETSEIVRARAPLVIAETRHGFVCGDDPDAKALGLELAGHLTTGRALDAGPLASARALEGLTAVIVNMNRRYKGHAGIKVTGLA